MCAKRVTRDRQRGSSFTSCLLTLIIVFGGAGFYYFNYFQWRHFEAPTEGLNYFSDPSAPQLNEFRKQTVAKIIDPMALELKQIGEIRKKTKKGTTQYPEMTQDLTEVKNRLKALMNEARLRRIPTKFKKQYEQVLLSLKDGYDSINALQESFAMETDEQRKKLYNESVKKSNAARKKLGSTRDYFSGNAWAD